MNQRIHCNSIRNILSSALSGIVPPKNSAENPIPAEIPPIKPQVAIPDPYDLAYQAEMILRCEDSPLLISLSNYLINRMESH